MNAKHRAPWDVVLTPTKEVRITTICADAHQVYLLLSDENAVALLLTQLEATADGKWTLTLPLKPGQYRYRFYADYGRVNIYLSPVQVDGASLRMDGLDAVLEVAGDSPEQFEGPGKSDSSDGPRGGGGWAWIHKWNENGGL